MNETFRMACDIKTRRIVWTVGTAGIMQSAVEVSSLLRKLDAKVR
tara:strand:- start:120 stop:254 length:135 start_codon:yes stop_codon:yes gene_type:complete